MGLQNSCFYNLFQGCPECWKLEVRAMFPGGTSGKEPAGQCRPRKAQVQPLGGEDSLEKEMATCSSVLAWRIPWTEEPGGLQSKGRHGTGLYNTLKRRVSISYLWVIIKAMRNPARFGLRAGKELSVKLYLTRSFTKECSCFLLIFYGVHRVQ